MPRIVSAIISAMALCVIISCSVNHHPVFIGDYEWWTLNFPGEADPFDAKQSEPHPRAAVIDQAVPASIDLKKATFIELRSYREKAIALYYQVRQTYNNERALALGIPDNETYLYQTDTAKLSELNAKWQNDLSRNSQARQLKSDLFALRAYIKYLGQLIEAKTPQ